MSEWFKQIAPKYPGCVRRFISTACFECFIDISAWGGEWPSVTIGLMSNCSAAYYTTLWGRIRTALNILRYGQVMGDITFDTQEEVNAFCEHLKIVSGEVFDDKLGGVR